MGEELRVVMFPFLGFGHISPFLQLARKLASPSSSSSSTRAPMQVTILSAPGNVARITSLLPSPTSIHVLPLTMPLVAGLPPGAESTADIDPSMSALLHTAIDLMEPQVAKLLATHKPHFLFFDFATPWIPSIASQLNIKTIFFSVFSAATTAFLTVPARRATTSIADLSRPPDGFPASSSITSVPIYQAADFYYIFTASPNNETVYQKVMTCLEGCTAVVAKTCSEMEGMYIDYVELQLGKRMLLAGPLVPESNSGVLEDKWAEWLGRFTEGSVVFCSFGSETFLSDDAASELVLGLEKTGMPFFAVLNRGGEAVKLAEGLEERVRGRGVVHRGWVQQQLILQHKNVGCFVCHAGLSSVMEGLVADCQLVMLPQKGDQYLNSALFAGDLKVGVEVTRNPVDGSFGRDAVCEAVRRVTGEDSGTVRENHRRWRDFLMDSKVHAKFTEDLVEQMELLAAV